jgi:hypothetical protein
MSEFRPLGIVLHVSASTGGDACDIGRWHHQRGFREIGYHRVLRNGVDMQGDYAPRFDGAWQLGRSDTEQGAHCLARGMNQCTLGVCVIGNPGWTVDGPGYLPHGPIGRMVKRPYMTVEQSHSLIRGLARLCRAFAFDPTGTFIHPATGARIPVITQHSDHDPQKPFCASMDLRIVRRRVKRAMREAAMRTPAVSGAR